MLMQSCVNILFVINKKKNWFVDDGGSGKDIK